MTDAATTLEIVDWRRRVFSLYSTVRDVAGTDPRAAHALWRTGRDELFAVHPASPLVVEQRAVFTGLPIAPYDAAWRFESTIEEPAVPQRLDVPTGTDGDVPFELVGRATVGEAGTLDVWRIAAYGGGLFVPVKDALAGRPGGTYGGGRYLLDTIKGADLGTGHSAGSIVLDFNFAYNPSCAYDPAWACPLAPPGNVLSVAIPVGELYG
jgi:uncharacterized protein